MFACLLGIASTVSAQFVNTRSGSSSSMNSSSDVTAWSGLRISYHPVSFNGDGDDLSFNGASVSYVKSFKVSNTAPLFIETGLNASWIGGEVEDTDIKLNMFSLNVPVNFGYKFAFGENNGIFPFVGLTFRGNIFGQLKYDDESINVFDEDEVGDAWKRFQIGWQIGVGANFNTFFVGASYGTDFSEILDGGKVAMPSISIGFNM